jgi:hypothetical protein
MQPIYESNSDDNNQCDLETESSTSSYNNKPKKIDKLKNFFGGSSMKKSLIQSESHQSTESPSNICCKLCNDDINQSTCIILSCNHIFHITCLADIFFKDIYNYDILNEEYFENIKCTSCNCKLEVEEMMFLHSKFLSSTKSLIQNHENSIDTLESQLKQIKNELRTCYDYKHKLEKQREKSKQIVSILNTIM